MRATNSIKGVNDAAKTKETAAQRQNTFNIYCTQQASKRKKMMRWDKQQLLSKLIRLTRTIQHIHSAHFIVTNEKSNEY